MFAKKFANRINPANRIIPSQISQIIAFPDRARRAVDPPTIIEVTPVDREKFTKNLTE